MVNITARQWVSKSLILMRVGRGAVALPPPPAPQLTSILVRYPRTRGTKPGAKTDGINKILKEYIPRMKYHNPALKINVDNPKNMGATCMLTLHFEGTDPEALRAIAQKSPRTEKTMPGPKRLRDTPLEKVPADDPKSKFTFVQHRPSADDDDVVLKPQPAANPSSPSTVSPPTPIYTRTVTLATDHRPHWIIWKWMRHRTGSTTIAQGPDDDVLASSIHRHGQAAAEMREQTKVVAEKIKNEKAALAKAKKAADDAAAGTA